MALLQVPDAVATPDVQMTVATPTVEPTVSLTEVLLPSAPPA